MASIYEEAPVIGFCAVTGERKGRFETKEEAASELGVNVGSINFSIEGARIVPHFKYFFEYADSVSRVGLSEMYEFRKTLVTFKEPEPEYEPEPKDRVYADQILEKDMHLDLGSYQSLPTLEDDEDDDY